MPSARILESDAGPFSIKVIEILEGRLFTIKVSVHVIFVSDNY